MEETSAEVAAALLRLNLQGPLALARAALPLMARQGRGQHVVVASMSGGSGCRKALGGGNACLAMRRHTGCMLAAPQLFPAHLAALLDKPCPFLPPAAAVVPSPGQSVYAAAKSGLRAYFASMTTELCDAGVGATVCCPGPLLTGLEGKPRLVYGPRGLITQARRGRGGTCARGERRCLR